MEETRLPAVEVSSEPRALWSFVNRLLSLSFELESLLEVLSVPSVEPLEDDFGAWAMILDSKLWAVEVSPDSRALCRELRASSIGFELLDELEERALKAL